eukprot:6181496-Pleurochrysis_carterae.AAC.2
MMGHFEIVWFLADHGADLKRVHDTMHTGACTRAHAHAHMRTPAVRSRLHTQYGLHARGAARRRRRRSLRVLARAHAAAHALTHASMRCTCEAEQGGASASSCAALLRCTRANAQTIIRSARDRIRWHSMARIPSARLLVCGRARARHEHSCSHALVSVHVRPLAPPAERSTVRSLPASQHTNATMLAPALLTP